jgi:hypothetical protein
MSGVWPPTCYVLDECSEADHRSGTQREKPLRLKMFNPLPSFS